MKQELRNVLTNNHLNLTSSDLADLESNYINFGP